MKFPTTMKITTLLRVIAFVAALTAPLTHAVYGKPGTLDPTWAPTSPLGPGIATASFAGVSANGTAVGIYSVAEQADGKLVVAGYCVPPTGKTGGTFCASRYLSNGSLDTTFNGTGSVAWSSPEAASGWANAVAIQPDGKILLAGVCDYGTAAKLCAIRYTSTGALDASFNRTGYVREPIDRQTYITSVALQPDGKFLAAGVCYDGSNWFTGTNVKLCLTRRNADGALDTGFGNGGQVTASPVDAALISSVTVVLQNDGKLLVGSNCSSNTKGTSFNDLGLFANARFCAMRYLANGSLDASFGTSGFVSQKPAVGSANFNAIALLPDGKILLAGLCFGALDPAICMLKLNSNGTVDSSFSRKREPWGRMCSGWPEVPIGSPELYLDYYSWNFSPGALATCDQQPWSYSVTLALQADGKIVLGGMDFYGDKLARVNTDGSIDESFGARGVASTPWPYPELRNAPFSPVAATLILRDGKIVQIENNMLRRAASFIVRYDAFGVTRPLAEFWHRGLDYYFYTSRPAEMGMLRYPEWSSTGNTIPVLIDHDPSSSPLDRFYFDKVARNKGRGSHFYTALPAEISALRALNTSNQSAPGLPVDDGADSYVFLPNAAGGCGNGLVPVYRAFRGNAKFPDDPNHRFTTDFNAYSALTTLQGWDAEGVKFCVPRQ